MTILLLAEPVMKNKDSNKVHLLKLGSFLLMFILSVNLHFILIMAAGRLIISGDTTRSWILMMVIELCYWAEKITGLLLLRFIGHEINLVSLLDRIHWRGRNGWQARIHTVVVLILRKIMSMDMTLVNRALTSVPCFLPPDWWPEAPNHMRIFLLRSIVGYG